jgi:L-ribulose-5-phosphate 3-epimerase
MAVTQTRREFIVNSSVTAALLSTLPDVLADSDTSPSIEIPKIHIFSKHLQFLNYQDMAEVAANLGFDGVDLTVRPNGHVLPENVEIDLPKAIGELKKVGFSPLLMTTAVEDRKNPIDYRLLTTAAKEDIKYYRMNWYQFIKGKTLPESIAEFGNKMTGLSQLNKTLGLVSCYQNHSGRMVGASVWEIWEMLKKTDPAYSGTQYDIRHATVEGGLSWQTGFELIRPSVKTIVLKDFIWEKKNGKWDAVGIPLGEGMVDFKSYFRLLKQFKIQVPISLHLEYPLGGAEYGATKLSVNKTVIFDAMKRDLARAKQLWEIA